MRVAQNEAHLVRLITLLRRRAMTAKQISKLTGCSKPIAYARIETLQARGLKLVRKKVREGKSGPKAVSYAVKS